MVAFIFSIPGTVTTILSNCHLHLIYFLPSVFRF